jgi:cyclic beta-1,2-glucan synthetase
MRARFHAEPLVQATDLLLQERTPRGVAVARPPAEDVMAMGDAREFVPPVVRRFTTPHGGLPRTHILSNGRYAVMITSAGGGYSRWGGIAVTRWREDVTRDVGGTYVYLRDVHSGDVWSAGYQPTGREPDRYEAVFSEDRAKIARQDGPISTSLDVLVSPEDDAEVRRVSIMNLGLRTREIELTSYAEVVLVPPAADAAHPAFSNLFVQTECLPELDVVLATRRRRSADEPQLWLAHVVAVEGDTVGPPQWETDRARFLGRGHGLRMPLALEGKPLFNSAGSVLDPIVSLRRRVRVPPGLTVRVSFSTMVAPSREEALGLAEKYRDAATFDRAATLAWTQAQVQLHHIGITRDEAHLFQSLARRVLFLDRTLRPSADVLARDTGGPAALWPHGISGDIPIVLVQIDDPDNVGIVRQLLRAHEYWRMKQLAVDLVILNERPPSYVQDLQSLLETLVRTSQSAAAHAGHVQHGNVYILRSDRITPPQRDALLTAARAVLSSRHGTLAEQITREHRTDASPPASPRRSPVAKQPPDLSLPRPDLELWNGLGGFADNGREYVTYLERDDVTPAPWINVVSNPAFGFQVSESGSGYTWSANSRENQLTPWSNDPISDPPGEALYLRDEESGDLWTPTALPIREAGQPYMARHGQGYSRFEHASHGISLELLQFVALEDPIKVSRLTVRNTSGRRRRLSVTAYVEWVLGVSRSASAPFIVTEIDANTKAMTARNTWASDFGGRVAFADLGGLQTAWTGDRTEFLGRTGGLDRPAALVRDGRLSGRVGPGLDPCGALQTILELRAGEQIDVVFFLGEAATREEAGALLARYRTADLDAVLRAVMDRWNEVLGAVQVKTPDRSMDLLLNRWLLYQTLACRVWSRSAFYQAGGAYGFRDQLQDVMALSVATPGITREHILRAAGRQFTKGDVQHWWHPPSGRGVRTRISDDAVWLPYAVLHYLDTTGDAPLLDEVVPFLDGRILATGEEESYFQPGVSPEQGTLFEHCARALDRALAVGAHGLPLMGTGDWNDGLNRVGREGRGESVWLGWFLHVTLHEFARVAEGRGEQARADSWRQHAASLKVSLDEQAWDGDWYRRAYFDDGTPLGSAASEECRIDSIAQSWAVISGAAEPSRAARAMAAAEARLIRPDDGLMILLDPPFDRTALDPGYIKGYPPGIRENGGQYTHAALWSVIAFATLGQGDRAHGLFSMLNPLTHASTRAGALRYRVEPYVVAADVYAERAHLGRGGWTWYTGSAGWTYRAGLEWLLGFRVRGQFLHLDPCIPRGWPGFEIAFRHRSTRYEITVENPRGVSRGVSSVEVDGAPPDSGLGPLRLVDDGAIRKVRVVLG